MKLFFKVMFHHLLTGDVCFNMVCILDVRDGAADIQMWGISRIGMIFEIIKNGSFNKNAVCGKKIKWRAQWK